jgi:superfamily II DNA/RNA helicase
MDFEINDKTNEIRKGNKKAKGFRAFNLDEKLIDAIKKIGYKFPTPIQRKTIPPTISGFNVIAHSRTGKIN